MEIIRGPPLGAVLVRTEYDYHSYDRYARLSAREPADWGLKRDYDISWERNFFEKRRVRDFLDVNAKVLATEIRPPIIPLLLGQEWDPSLYRVSDVYRLNNHTIIIESYKPIVDSVEAERLKNSPVYAFFEYLIIGPRIGLEGLVDKCIKLSPEASTIRITKTSLAGQHMRNLGA